jgi:hypothetical protein
MPFILVIGNDPLFEELIWKLEGCKGLVEFLLNLVSFKVDGTSHFFERVVKDVFHEDLHHGDPVGEAMMKPVVEEPFQALSLEYL